MSTFTAVGPALNVDGPLPVAPRHSLLSTAGVVESRDATRVLNGVNVWGYPTGCSELWEPCSDGTFRTKGSDSEQLMPRFDAFVVYKPITCSTISVGDPQEFFNRVQAVLDATLSAGVERMLAEGVVESSNPFFGDASVDVLAAGAAVSPGVGLSYLEEALGTECRRGMIHATPAVVAALQASPLDPVEVLETPNGTPVVSGMGYQGIDTPWLSTPAGTRDWVFATGPVEVHLGPVRLDTISENLDRELNVVTYRAEQYVVALWDTAIQAAILVDWAT